MEFSFLYILEISLCSFKSMCSVGSVSESIIHSLMYFSSIYKYFLEMLYMLVSSRHSIHSRERERCHILISGLKEVQVLDGSLQREFSERQIL